MASFLDRWFRSPSRSMIAWHIACGALLGVILLFSLPGDMPNDEGNFMPMNLIMYEIGRSVVFSLQLYATALLAIVWLSGPSLLQAGLKLARQWRPHSAAFC